MTTAQLKGFKFRDHTEKELEGRDDDEVLYQLIGKRSTGITYLTNPFMKFKSNTITVKMIRDEIRSKRYI